MNTKITSKSSGAQAISSPSLPSEACVQIAAQLSVQMEIRYGDAWTRRIDNTDKLRIFLTEWGGASANATPEQIKRALALCDRTHPDYPPTLGQWKECLRTIVDPYNGMRVRNPAPKTGGAA